jgi:hypothetical protein
MTIERMEAYALEMHDQIVINDNVYKIYDIYNENEDEILFYLVDEEGIRHKVRVHETAKLPMLVGDLVDL